MVEEESVEQRLLEGRWRAVGEIAHRIAVGEPIDDILASIATWARALLGRRPPFLAATEAERAAIGVRPAGTFLYTPDRQHLRLHGGVDFPPEQIGMRIPVDHGLPGLVARTGERMLVTNTDDEPRFVQIIATGRAGSTCQVPVKIGGECLGLVFVASMEQSIYWLPDLEALQVFADLATAALRCDAAMKS